MAVRKSKLRSSLLCCLLWLHGGCTDAPQDPDLTIAVAANFLATAETLVDEFTSQYPARVTLIGGSTGKLYAQIVNGAPFDIFLAADEARPRRLEEFGYAVANSGVTYAHGQLTLWSADPRRISGNGAEILARGDFTRLAIANPALAPYGAAAREVLEHYGVWHALEKRLVMGENAGQAYALVTTGNAQLGLVALAHASSPATMNRGSRWDVPTALHAPIAQRAVLLQRGADNAAARKFMEYLESSGAVDVIRKAGYVIE